MIKRGLKRVVALLPASLRHRIRKRYSRFALARETEPPEFSVLRHFIDDECIVVDAGANVGLYTRFLSQHGRQSEVWSVEPIPTTFDLLRSNVQALGMRNVRLIPHALSDRSQSVVMEIPETAGEPVHYLARIKYSDATKPPLRDHVVVETRTLDSLVDGDRRRVCLIKCDVEMHELEMLTGAMAVLRRDHPAIYAEIQPDFRTKRSQRDDIIRLLAPEGYSPYWYDGGVLRRWTPRTGDVLDLFFLTAGHLRRVGQRGVAAIES
jgi:FkbM family methyltransferase